MSRLDEYIRSIKLNQSREDEAIRYYKRLEEFKKNNKEKEEQK